MADFNFGANTQRAKAQSFQKRRPGAAKPKPFKVSAAMKAAAKSFQPHGGSSTRS